MQRNRRRHAGDFEHRRAQVDRHDEIVVHLARCDVAGPPQDHRNAGSLVVEELLAANVTAAVIGDEDDERVACESFVIQSLEQLADAAVGHLGLFQSVRPVPADERCIGVLRRDRDIGFVDRTLRIAEPRPVRALKRDAGEERLPVGSLAPVAAVEKFVVCIGQEVHVDLPAHQAGEVAGIVHQVRDRADAVRQRLLVVGPVLLGSDEVLMEASHHCRPRGRTNRRGRERLRVTTTHGCEAVDVRRVDGWRAVAGEVGRPVLDRDPQDVRPLIVGSEGNAGEQDREKRGESEHGHAVGYSRRLHAGPIVSKTHRGSSGRRLC